MEKRNLPKSKKIRFTEEEVCKIDSYLKENNLTFQYLLRGYVLSLVNDPDNTPVYERKVV